MGVGRKLLHRADHRTQVLLDLWNFGLRSRVEYPTLSNEAATGMPIELFIGNNREVTMEGVRGLQQAHQSVLVPESFLSQANESMGVPMQARFLPLERRHGDGPPRARFPPILA